MNRTREQQEPGSGMEARSPAFFRERIRSRLAEYIGFALLLAVANLPLFGCPLTFQSAFFSAAVQAGEWWRILLHPFAHVGMYHLMLDGAAFFILYHGLRESSLWRRLGYVVGSAAGSLCLAVLMAPAVQAIGLCGLSGVGHGLMAVMALEMIASKDWMGWPCLAGVLAKAVWEAVSGHVVFEQWHVGSVGVPVVISHLGGLMGAVMFWLATSRVHWPWRRLNARQI